MGSVRGKLSKTDFGRVDVSGVFGSVFCDIGMRIMFRCCGSPKQVSFGKLASYRLWFGSWGPPNKLMNIYLVPVWKSCVSLSLPAFLYLFPRFFISSRVSLCHSRGGGNLVLCVLFCKEVIPVVNFTQAWGR